MTVFHQHAMSILHCSGLESHQYITTKKDFTVSERKLETQGIRRISRHTLHSSLTKVSSTKDVQTKYTAPRNPSIDDYAKNGGPGEV